MNYEHAKQMAEAFRQIGGFSAIEVEHFGFWSRHTAELDNDNNWEVRLWAINARAGNRNLEVVRAFALDQAPALARKAKGKATAEDRRAFARMAAEAEINQS